MGRRARFTFPLANGQIVGASPKVRDGMFYVQFKHATEDGKYVELGTGIAVPKGYSLQRDPPPDWFTATAKLILKHYTPTLPTDSRKASWEEVVADLSAGSDLRPRSLEVYVSTLNIFRRYAPDSKGPGDVTVDVAVAFRKKYAADGFTRSPVPGAKKYPRSAKTVENAIRRMSGLWSKLIPKYATTNPWEHVSRPTVPKKMPIVPTEEDVSSFFKWLTARYPEWDLPRVFVEVKMISGCRLNDLCQVRTDQFDAKKHTLTIRPEQDKTHRERILPLPPDLSARLNAVKGPTYLWERYLEDSKKWRPAKRTKKRTDFTPELMYHGMQNIFREFAEQGGKLRSHGLRKRAITLMTLATQSVDQTAEAIGIDSQTARRYYLDSKKAFGGAELLKQMASVLRPQNQPTESPAGK